eukprot:jgi/Chrzof1/10389/Cz04g40050.t1
MSGQPADEINTHGLTNTAYGTPGGPLQAAVAEPVTPDGVTPAQARESHPQQSASYNVAKVCNELITLALSDGVAVTPDVTNKLFKLGELLSMEAGSSRTEVDGDQNTATKADLVELVVVVLHGWWKVLERTDTRYAVMILEAAATACDNYAQGLLMQDAVRDMIQTSQPMLRDGYCGDREIGIRSVLSVLH